MLTLVYVKVNLQVTLVSASSAGADLTVRLTCVNRRHVTRLTPCLHSVHILSWEQPSVSVNQALLVIDVR